MLKSLKVLSRSLKTALLLSASLVAGGTLASGCGTTEIDESGGETHFLIRCESNETCTAIDPSWHCREGYCRSPEDAFDASTDPDAAQGEGNHFPPGQNPTGTGGTPATAVDPDPSDPDPSDPDPNVPDPELEDSGTNNPPNNSPNTPETPDPPLSTLGCHTDDDCEECESCQHETDAGLDADTGFGNCIPKAMDAPCTDDSNACTADVCDGASSYCLHKLLPECTSCALQNLPRINAVASSPNGGNTAQRAIDTSTGTRWESQQGVDPQWIYVDLGANMNISAVTLDWETASAKNYAIQVASDGTCAGSDAGCLSTDTPWTTVFVSPTYAVNANHRIDNISLNATGRYVRMKGTARMTMYGYSLWDFAIHGTTSTECECISELVMTSAVASTVTGGNVAGSAIDNSTGTRWESVQPAAPPNTNVVDPPDPSWIYVDLGSNKSLDHIILDWEAASAKTYQVQIAPDGTCAGSGPGCLGTSDPWQTLASVTNPSHVNHRIDTMPLDGVGRYVRVYATTRTGGYGYSLYEIDIFGGPLSCNDADAGAGDAGVDAGD